MARKIVEIAFEIGDDWTNVHYGAKPYLQAMYGLEYVEDKYGLDSAVSIIVYFLSNARTWKGEVARRVKKELNEMVKEARTNNIY